MFIPDPRFLTDLATDRPTKEALTKAAQKAADEANEIQNHIMPGDPEDITVEEIDGDIFMVNHNHGGHIDEWGSKNNPAYAPLRNGVRKAGFELTED